MDQTFKNKVVLITGASFGIGKSSAIEFAKRGAKLILADCIQDNDVIDTIKTIGVEVLFVQCDVSKSEDVQNLMQKAMTHFGRIDCAFNNAGIEGIPAPTADCTEENWAKVIGVNLSGIWLCMKFQIPIMLQQGKGCIVNNASVAGLVGFPNSPAYVASKHGVVGLTKTAALEYAKQGIRINAVCPGIIRTPMIDRFTGKNKEVEKQFESMEPVGRMGEPEEVANLAIWLCSDESSFVTGQAIAVDGGWVTQ